MELETYKKAERLIKEREQLESASKSILEAIRTPTFRRIIFEWDSDYCLLVFASNEVQIKILESMKNIVETRLEEINKEFEKL